MYRKGQNFRIKFWRFQIFQKANQILDRFLPYGARLGDLKTPKIHSEINWPLAKLCSLKKIDQEWFILTVIFIKAAPITLRITALSILTKMPFFWKLTGWLYRRWFYTTCVCFCKFATISNCFCIWTWIERAWNKKIKYNF